MSQHHVLRAGPETCHWGFFDAGLRPVLTVASGDTVTIESVSGGPEVLPQRGNFDILPDHLAIHRGLQLSLRDGLALEIEVYNRMVPTEDRREGVLAFNEKRPPNFKGK